MRLKQLRKLFGRLIPKPPEVRTRPASEIALAVRREERMRREGQLIGHGTGFSKQLKHEIDIASSGRGMR